MPDGNFERISLEQALEEIAAKLREIIDRDGPEAVSAVTASGGFLTAASLMLTRDWLSALGSLNYYSTLTIAQSATVVTAARIGTWQAGTQNITGNAGAMLFVVPPLVAMTQSTAPKTV